VRASDATFRPLLPVDNRRCGLDPPLTVARIIARRETPVSPWVRVVENTVELAPNTPPEAFHCLAQADYVTVVARTRSGLIPIVSQFRPAVGCITWELPGGLLEAGEAPEVCCRRELREEVGVEALQVTSLGRWFPDTGRLENRGHVFAVEGSDPDPEFVPEPGTSVEYLSPSELRARIRDGSFAHLAHIGALALAALDGFDHRLLAP
jgi:ADP-ribose pyrophosphatase